MIKHALKLLGPAAVVAALIATGPASAIVPPKDCGRVTVSHKRYNIKADQLKCDSARRYSITYLKSRTKPRHYRCYRYSGSKLVFKCVNTSANPDKTFFAIKR